MKKNKERESLNTYYTEMLTDILTEKVDVHTAKTTTDQLENILDIRYNISL